MPNVHVIENENLISPFQIPNSLSRVMTEAASLIGFQGQSTTSMTAMVLWIMCWAVVIQKALVLEWRRQWV